MLVLVELNVGYGVKDADKETREIFNKLEGGGTKVVGGAKKHKKEIGVGTVIIVLGVAYILLKD